MKDDFANKRNVNGILLNFNASNSQRLNNNTLSSIIKKKMNTESNYTVLGKKDKRSKGVPVTINKYSSEKWVLPSNYLPWNNYFPRTYLLANKCFLQEISTPLEIVGAWYFHTEILLVVIFSSRYILHCEPCLSK